MEVSPATSRRRPRPSATPLAYRLADLPARTGISLSGWRNLISAGSVRVQRVGRAVLVPAAEVARITGSSQS